MSDSSIGWVTPRRIPAEDLPFRADKRDRAHVAVLIRRADWLSRRIRAARHGHRLDLAEFDALVWALTRIAGAEVVNKWLGVIDKAPGEVAGWDEHTTSSMKDELPPEEQTP